jgi:acyl dehydratase
MARFFEDIETGETATFGRYHVTEAEVIEFATQYDPQWFHTDPERAAEESMYGGLIASGWHTAAMTMRMLVDNYLDDIATVGAKGLEELRWRRPVRPGDVLSVETEVLGKDPERDDRGLLRVRTETTTTEDGNTVLVWTALVMVARRDDG